MWVAIYFQKIFSETKKEITFAVPKGKRGTIAQLVEQRTENPCVAGSIPAGTTTMKPQSEMLGVLLF